MAVHVRSLVAGAARGKDVRIESTITVNRPLPELFRFWRDFENLPHFLAHLKSVRIIDELRSHWVVVTTAGTYLEWNAMVHNEIQDELITWRSHEDSEVNIQGAVHFRPAPFGRGTELRVVLSYEVPTSKLGRLIARLFGEDPSLQVRAELRRFKALAETGEIPTTAGQSSGRWEARGPVGSASTEVTMRADWDPPARADERVQ